ncbi:cell death abnormality protein 1-like, partial [Argopecten irradians]|uniref:cell death abnormality protein 1-like n=1 Tax=Argopecten irradians TaxID=31199 RepID=UPI003722DC7E
YSSGLSGNHHHGYQEVCCSSWILFAFNLCSVSEIRGNLSLGRNTSQSSTFNPRWSANKAVDGCLNQFISSDCCIHTKLNKTRSWWQVDIGSRTTVSNITLYYRAGYLHRFAGYQLYLSNVSDWTSGVLCYQDMNGDLADVESVVTHQCPYVARYVTIYNYRDSPKRHDWYSDNAVLELCEVQVFGCQIGHYGPGACNQTCSENCYGGNCDASTGSCLYCRPGKLGDACQNDCSINCKACAQWDGQCTDCVYGKWGDTCDQDCSPSCKDCVQDNGSCIDCNVGSYGRSCDLYCPTHCKGDACDRESGLCFECKPGKLGDKCDLDCSTSCKDLYCEQNTGICSECVDGMYGYYCDKSCAEGCMSNKCRRYDGRCEDADNSICVDISAVAALSVVATLFLVVAIIAIVCMQRYRSAAKKDPNKDNLSDGKRASQSTSYDNWLANNAVDNCLKQSMGSGCCIHTELNENEAWWQVDLGGRTTVSYITIYYRADFQLRFAGYQLYLSNTTDWTTGYLCYKDTSSHKEAVELIVTHQCPYVARFVTIYNYRGTPKRHEWYSDDAVLELCEVQVFGCQIGQYGFGACNQTCSENCYGGNCDASTGSCFYCRVGSYGQSCDLYCPTHCKGDACDRDSGLCFECRPGKHGDKCDLDCSTSCKDLYCEKSTGFCSECVDGMYGYYCDKSCAEECESNRCRRYDGTCEVTRLGETDKTRATTRVDIITVAALAVVAAIFLVAAIVAFICMQRFRSAAEKNQNKEEDHYTDIGPSGVNGPNMYEMATTQ